MLSSNLRSCRRQKHNILVERAENQADTYILQSSLQLREQNPNLSVNVISADHDFIGLGGDSISCVTDPFRRTIVRVQDVLTVLGVTPHSMMAAYCTSGCDDMRQKIKYFSFG